MHDEDVRVWFWRAYLAALLLAAVAVMQEARAAGVCSDWHRTSLTTGFQADNDLGEPGQVCGALAVLYGPGFTFTVCNVPDQYHGNYTVVEDAGGIAYPFELVRNGCTPDEDDGEPIDFGKTEHLLQALLVISCVFALVLGYRAGDKL